MTELIDKKKRSTQEEQKIKLIITAIFRHITEPSKKYTIYAKSRNIEMRAGDDTNDIVIKLLDTFLENYEREADILRNGSDYVFECVDLTHVQFHTIELKRGSSFIDSPKWIKDKHATINPKNTKDNCCFAYAIIAALHHEEIRKDPQHIIKLAPYIDNYNWKDIDFPAEEKDCKTFERNNKDIALNILSAPFDKKKINIIRRSEYNRKREKVVHLLMITDNQNNWHYLAVKSIKRLCRGVTSNNHGDFYCLNCLHPYRTENALKKHERLCNNHDYCKPIMPKPGKNILKYCSGEKSLHIPHIIYADLEVLFRKFQSCQPNPENSYTVKKNVHVPSGYALYLLRTCNQKLTTHYRGIDCMQKFVRAIKIMAMMMIDTKQKK